MFWPNWHVAYLGIELSHGDWLQLQRIRILCLAKAWVHGRPAELEEVSRVVLSRNLVEVHTLLMSRSFTTLLRQNRFMDLSSCLILFCLVLCLHPGSKALQPFNSNQTMKHNWYDLLLTKRHTRIFVYIPAHVKPVDVPYSSVHLRRTDDVNPQYAMYQANCYMIRYSKAEATDTYNMVACWSSISHVCMLTFSE